MRLALVVLALALAGPAAAQPAPGAPPDDAPFVPEPAGKDKWRVSLGLPDDPDQQDGQHIQVTWTRYDKTVPVKVAVFRRELHDAPWKDAKGRVRPADPETHVGGGLADLTGAPQFGDAFVNGFYAQKDAAGKIEIIDQPVPIADHVFSVGDQVGLWTLIAMVDDKQDEKQPKPSADDDKKSVVDEVGPGGRYLYALVPFTPGAQEGAISGFPIPGVQLMEVSPETSFFNRSRWFYLTFVALTALAFFGYMQLAKKRAKQMFIRRIPGVDAIEDAIGRSTEMGRPVLYVTGTDDLVNIQTMASLLILGHVAQMTAEYDTEIKVANLYPLTMVVAEEIVRQGYSNAGRIDAHKPENVLFISSEQFAYAAAINGMILRDKPATNIFIGRYFAESLLLAEAGFSVGAVQIAGTAEFTQLPFFIAACDYTLIGEEMYATSAYLTREPNLMAQLKAGDVMKALIMILVGVGAVLATAGVYQLGAHLLP
jgi:hypothetical protein